MPIKRPEADIPHQFKRASDPAALPSLAMRCSRARRAELKTLALTLRCHDFLALASL